MAAFVFNQTPGCVPSFTLPEDKYLQSCLLNECLLRKSLQLHQEVRISTFQQQGVGHSVDMHTGDFVKCLVLVIVSRFYVAAPIQPL